MLNIIVMDEIEVESCLKSEKAQEIRKRRLFRLEKPEKGRFRIVVPQRHLTIGWEELDYRERNKTLIYPSEYWRQEIFLIKWFADERADAYFPFIAVRKMEVHDSSSNVQVNAISFNSYRFSKKAYWRLLKPLSLLG